MLTAKYTGDGLRAWKQPGATGKRYFLYDGTLPIIEVNKDGEAVAVNTFGANGLVSRTEEGGASTFYTFDLQGSVAQRLDAWGNALSSHLFAAHGAEVTTPSADPFGYGAQWGYYTDRETGLQLLTYRYYDPQAGRFLTRDPAGYAGGINLYSYVENDPTNDSDALGLTGGRGPGHSVSLNKDPWEWLKRFVGRRRRFSGDPGHEEQLGNQCRHLEKWLASLTSVSRSDANLMRHLMTQYDWCRKRFPSKCNEPSLAPPPAVAPGHSSPRVMADSRENDSEPFYDPWDSIGPMGIPLRGRHGNIPFFPMPNGGLPLRTPVMPRPFIYEPVWIW